MIPAAHLLITSFFFFLNLIISISYSLKDSQKFFMQSLPLHISCLFYLLLNDNITETGKPDRICSSTFAADELPALFLHPSVFFIKH